MFIKRSRIAEMLSIGEYFFFIKYLIYGIFCGFNLTYIYWQNNLQNFNCINNGN